MTNDKIIEMAKQARISTASGYFGSMEQIITFARLIEREAREEAARMCDKLWKDEMKCDAYTIAAAIREGMK